MIADIVDNASREVGRIVDNGIRRYEELRDDYHAFREVAAEVYQGVAQPILRGAQEGYRETKDALEVIERGITEYHREGDQTKLDLLLEKELGRVNLRFNPDYFGGMKGKIEDMEDREAVLKYVGNFLGEMTYLASHQKEMKTFWAVTALYRPRHINDDFLP